MTRLLEHDALRLLAGVGVAVPRFEVAGSPDEAEAAARRLDCPVVLKALVPVGGRGKAGAVREAREPGEAAFAAHALLDRSVGEYPIRRLLVMERIEIAEELFASLTFDSVSRGPVLLLSRAGGVEVESLVERGGRLVRRPISISRGLRPFEGREAAVDAGLERRLIVQAGDLLSRLYVAFRSVDARLLEVNPLAVTADGALVPAAAVVDLDEQALFRHPEIASRLSDDEGTGQRPFTALERRMREIDRALPEGGAMRFLEFPDGDLACMITSGGAGLAVLGSLVSMGGRPATGFDITPGAAGPMEEKLYLVARAILERPGVRGLLAGGNVKNFTRVDVHVRAIVRALRDSEVDARRFPVVLRFAGPGIELAREAARGVPGLELYEDDTSLDHAARRILERMRESTAR